MTAEDKAAALLAYHLGYGSVVTRDYVVGFATPWTPGYNGDESTPAAVTGLHVAWETETLERAKHAIPHAPKRPGYPDKRPSWLKRLPAEQQAALTAWSDTHPFRRGVPDRVRELNHWKTPSFVVIPNAPSGAAASFALATLPRPLQAVLCLVALEQGEHVQTVMAMLRGAGATYRVAIEAVMRWLYPELTHTQQAVGKRLTMRKASVPIWLQDHDADIARAVRLLRRWQHKASVMFVRAFGRPAIGTRKAVHGPHQPVGRLSLPRFRKGWDARQKPEPIVIVSGTRKQAHFAVTGRKEPNRHSVSASRRRAA